MSKDKQKRTLYSWDSSCLLALLNAEPEHLQNLLMVADEISNRRANFVYSTMLHYEISRAKHTPEQISVVERFLKRSNIQPVDPNGTVMRLAGEIRDALIREDKELKRADGTILATAVLYDADVLHSADHHHLRLNGHPILNGLRITHPKLISGQTSLFKGQS